MTDFSGGQTSPENDPQEQTDFSAGHGGEPNDNNTPSDGEEVVLEHEGRQYTKADLVKKLSHSDEFINTLKKEREEDRQLLQQVNEKLEGQVETAEVLKQIKEGKMKPEDLNTDGGDPDKDKGDSQPVDPEKIKSEVLGELGKERQKEQEESNWKQVTETLGKQFGQKSNDVVAKRAEENGITVEEAASLARTKPKVFLSMFPELNSKPSSSSAVHGSTQNSEAVARQDQERRGPSGYVGAKNIKERTEAYLQRLQELEN